MSSLQELADDHTNLSVPAVDHLQAVVGDWQILSDLAFADLLLFLRNPVTNEVVVAAQMRPYTAQTLYHEDLVGVVVRPGAWPLVDLAFVEARIVRDGENARPDGVPVRAEAIPVTYDGDVVGVVSRESNLAMVRAPSALEMAYLESADELAQMLMEGSFPFPGEDPERELAPRVGDGLMRIDPAGTVRYASPNAISAYRRLGVRDNIVGGSIRDFDLDADALGEALADGEPLESEVEARGAVVLRRVIPLTRGHDVLGGLVLVREVTELRRHEALLLYKDATIREIHHRVKNNLQTVASLLRLQSRRLVGDEAREALGESVRRISSIALVHETLSQDSGQRVSFDKVAQRLVDMLASGLTDPACPVHMSLIGDAGELPAEVATPLALVLSELLQNAVEHAYPSGSAGGTIVVELDRRPTSLVMTVRDDGIGLPEGWSLSGRSNLGLQIAQTLVTSELNGSLDVRPPQDGTPGAECEARVPLPR